jgi:hypothetical protein
MSALLATLSRATDSKFCWLGRIDFRVPPPIAKPVVLTWNDHASIVFAAGALKSTGMLKLAELVLSEARRPENRIVYVALACQGGRLGSLRTSAASLAEARGHAAIVAVLTEVAYGPALWLAYHCDQVWAQPAASIGWLECFSEAGEFDSDATMAMIEDLAAMNPAVAPFTWARLVQSAATGEQAEALEVVGGLTRDVFALSGIDGNNWGPTR